METIFKASFLADLKVKFIYSEKATTFCEIFNLLLTVCTVVKSKVKFLQNFVALSEYMNFKYRGAWAKKKFRLVKSVLTLSLLLG